MKFLSDLLGIVPGPSSAKIEIKKLIAELVQIGNTEDFLSERPGGSFNYQCRHIRAIEIGRRLLELGGDPLMEYTLRQIKKNLGRSLLNHLEYSWEELGQWVP